MSANQKSHKIAAYGNLLSFAVSVGLSIWLWTAVGVVAALVFVVFGFGIVNWLFKQACMPMMMAAARSEG